MNRLTWPCAGLALLNFALCFLGLTYLRERDSAREDAAAWKQAYEAHGVIAWDCDRSFISVDQPQYNELVSEAGWCLRFRNEYGTWDRARTLFYKGKPVLVWGDERKAWVRP
jgi:hypothetical protein